MRTSVAFPEPNHTQTPNSFFEMVPDMSEAELRVTLVMIRNTFGWHRDCFKMGVSKLAKASGLSRQGVLIGAEAAERRGTFKRTNPDSIKEAEWELVTLQPVEGEGALPLQPVEGTPLAGRGQVGLNKDKEIIKENAPDGAKLKKDFSFDWSVGHDEPVTQEQLDKSSLNEQGISDCAHLIGQNAADLEPLAVAFMQTRGLLCPLEKKSIARWKAAFREMKQARPNPVQVEHVREATRQLMVLKYTIADPHAIKKVAIDLANKATVTPEKPESRGPVRFENGMAVWDER